MKPWKLITGAVMLAVAATLLLSFSRSGKNRVNKTTYRDIPRGCVYRTLMGEESSDDGLAYFTDSRVDAALGHGLEWVIAAQGQNGGWGSGSHNRQDVMDPHAVQSDPATTAMVSMALLRNGNTLRSGRYTAALRRSLEFLLGAVETSSESNPTITDLTGTQIQTKLGSNIDVILTSQFLSNLLEKHLDFDPVLKARVRKANNRCVAKIQRAQTGDGSFAGSGWAGVLQSSFATNALESAEDLGLAVDTTVLNRARDFQKNNYNAKTGDVNTALGAGVMLYSVTGSARASAKEARKVEEEMMKAVQSGRLSPGAQPTAQNLQEIGFSKDDAMRHATAYEVYQSAKARAQQDEVMDGFGSNGGEEFMSYLQTGESLSIAHDPTWKNWYENMSGRLLQIQNDDGSWNGHHCITSPVFCTATCLMILSVNND